MGTYPHSPGAYAVPYGVIDTRERYSVVFYTPMFTSEVMYINA
ncbi:MAG: hypothetical protein WAV05_03865 [Anaerolineales bacterium]